MSATLRHPRVTAEVPLPRISPRWLGWARHYSRGYLAKHFHAVRLLRGGEAPAAPAGRPVIVAMNHPSWWDPVLALVLSERLAGRLPYAPIDATGLARYPILGTIGLFGVEPGRAGARTFLEVGAAALASPNGALWVTPQGQFADPRERPIAIRPGLGHLAARTPGVVVVPLALEYTFWSERPPEAFAGFGAPIECEGGTAAEWTERIARGLEATQDDLARAVISRDPERFTVLAGGQAGIGGVYDLWRRAKAKLTGQSFRPEHDEARAAWR